MTLITSIGGYVDGTSVNASVETPLGSTRAKESEVISDCVGFIKPSDDTLFGNLVLEDLDNSVEVVPLESWRRVTLATLSGSSLTPSSRLPLGTEFLSS